MTKKIFAAAAAALMIAGMASAQSVKIYKNGEVVASYAIAEIDKVVFDPTASAEGPAEAIAGTYTATRSLSLKEMPGDLGSAPATFTIEATAADKATITLPECEYSGMGTPMLMPGVTMPDVAVEATEGGYALTGAYEGTEEGTGKKVTATLSGTIGTDGAIDLTEEMKYGSMPFTVVMKYTTPTAAE